MAHAIDYLEVVNKESAAAEEATGVVEAIAAIDGFLPMTLKLPAHLMEQVATIPIIVDLITQKVALLQGTWVLVFVMMDSLPSS